MRIALDAGHGYKKGKPTGAQGFGIIEDDLALTLCHKIRWYLIEAGHTVVLTRGNRDYVNLRTRAKHAKAEACDRFVSIHLNAFSNPEACGVEALCALGDTRSLQFADKLVDVVNFAGVRRRGIKWDSQSQYKSIYVLRNTYKAMPATLLEVAFLTNVHDAHKLKDKAWVEKLAAGLAKAIVS